MIYDAFGRRVEEPNPNDSGFIEILYGPDGSKLALMSGASVAHASVPLPPGATAVYRSALGAEFGIRVEHSAGPWGEEGRRAARG